MNLCRDAVAHRSTLIAEGALTCLLASIGVTAPIAAQQVCTTPWRLEEVSRLGSLDGAVTLTRIRDLEVGEGGKLYVAQGSDQYISVFSADGQPLERIGRAGEGPGELSGPPRRILVRSDTLVVQQPFSTLFLSLPEGDEQRRIQFRTRVPSESSTFMPGIPLADGTYLGHRYLNPPLRVFYASAELPLLRFTSEGEVVDTIVTVKRFPAIGDRAFQERFENWVLGHPLGAWSGESELPVATTTDGDAVVLVGEVDESSEPATFTLLKVAITGDTLFSRSIPYDPRQITRSERDLIREAFADQFADEGERTREAFGDAIAFPDHYPPVRQILAGQDNSIWLLRESSPAPADVWEIYSSDGTLEGSVRIDTGRSAVEPWAPRVRMLRATSDRAWGYTIDEFEVPYLHTYQVNRMCG